MVSIKHIADPKPQIEYELIQIISLVNIDERLTINKVQVPMISEMIFDTWKYVSIELISLALKRGAMGLYGTIYRLDISVLNEWIQKAVDEQSQLQEAGWTKEKQKDEKRKVDYDAFKKRLDSERRKQNELEVITRESRIQEISAPKYTSPTEEEVINHALHFEWIKANFDAITGERLPTWLSESEWLLTQTQ